jgi:hypothetical protein
MRMQTQTEILELQFRKCLSVDEHKDLVPNILIADDVASNLIALDFQLSVIKGPDNKRQICDKTADGNQLVDQYISRLEESIKSNWELMPY